MSSCFALGYDLTMPSEREWREGRRLPSRKALNMDSLAMFRLDWKKIVIICLYGSYLCCFSWWACRNWGMGDEDYAWQLFPWIVTSLALNVFCLFGINAVNQLLKSSLTQSLYFLNNPDRFQLSTGISI